MKAEKIKRTVNERAHYNAGFAYGYAEGFDQALKELCNRMRAVRKKRKETIYDSCYWADIEDIVEKMKDTKEMLNEKIAN